MPRVLPAMLVLLWSGAAWAHTSSQGFSTWEVTGRDATARLHFTPADLLEVAGVDADTLTRPARTLLADAEPLLLLHATQTIRLWSLDGDGMAEPCAGSATALELEPSAEHPAHLALTMHFACTAPPERIRVGLNFMAGTRVRHAHVARIRTATGEHQVVLTPDTREATLEALPSRAAVFRAFALLGMEHILLGFDHLLFLLVLLLAAPRARDMVLLVTGFTVAHSITLGLAALDVVKVPAHVVEPIIALSIVYVALENTWMLRTGRTPRVPRPLVTLGFGLVHGLGFASALAETGLPAHAVAVSLLAFNLGVEAGQLLACGVAGAVLFRVRRHDPRGRVPLVLGLLAAAMGTAWAVTRIMGA